MVFNIITSIPPSNDFSTGPQSTGPQGQNVTGPLGDLNQSGFNYNLYRYPQNLNGNHENGHEIIFYINIPQESFWNTSGSTNNNNGPQPVANRLGNASNFALRPDTGAGSDADSTGINQNTIGQVLQSKTVRTTDAISLYIPNTMVWNHSLQYQSISLSDALGVIGDVGYGITSLLNGSGRGAAASLASVLPDIAHDIPGVRKVLGGLGSGAKDALLQGLGIADNPQNFLLFKQIDFRRFQFEFVLTPESQQEAEVINQIIYLFRFHSVPEVLAGTGGRFFVPPSQFDFNIMHNGTLNTNIPQINTCVCTNVNVDYGSSGHWVTYTDGRPVQTVLSLAFTEISILTKDLLQNGF